MHCQEEICSHCEISCTLQLATHLLPRLLQGESCEGLLRSDRLLGAAVALCELGGTGGSNVSDCTCSTDVVDLTLALQLIAAAALALAASLEGGGMSESTVQAQTEETSAPSFHVCPSSSLDSHEARILIADQKSRTRPPARD